MSTEVKVPTLGESINEATVGEWLKQPGDAVAQDEPIVSLETDKVAIDVNAPVSGVLGEHAVAEGDNVTVGAVITVIEDETAAGTKQVSPREEEDKAVPAEDTPAKSEPAQTEAGGESAASDPAVLSPAVRRAVLEHGIDPGAVRGTGKDGRLTKEDVLAAVKARENGSPAPAPAPAPAPRAASPARGGPSG